MRRAFAQEDGHGEKGGAFQPGQLAQSGGIGHADVVGTSAGLGVENGLHGAAQRLGVAFAGAVQVARG